MIITGLFLFLFKNIHYHLSRKLPQEGGLDEGSQNICFYTLSTLFADASDACDIVKLQQNPV